MKSYKINKLDNHHYQIQMPLGNRVMSVYLFQGSRGWLLFDVSSKSLANGILRPALTSLKAGPDKVKFIVVSQAGFEHAGGLAVVRKMFPKATVVCGEADRAVVCSPDRLISQRYKVYEEYNVKFEPAFLKKISEEAGAATPVDVGVREGEVFDLGGLLLQVVSTAGQSDGHISLFNPQRRWFFSASAIQGVGIPNQDGSIARIPIYRDVHQYLSSIEKIDALKPEVFFSTYWPVYQGGEIARFFKDSKDFVSRYDRLLLQTCRSPQTTPMIIEACSSKLGAWTEGHPELMIFSLIGHINRLVKQRKMKGQKAGPLYRFQSL